MSLQAGFENFYHVTLGFDGVSKVRSSSSVFKSCTSVLRSKTTTSLHVNMTSSTTHMCTVLCMLLTNITSLQSLLGQNDWLMLHMVEGGGGGVACCQPHLSLFRRTANTDVGKLMSCMTLPVAVLTRNSLRGVSVGCSPAPTYAIKLVQTSISAILQHNSTWLN